MLSWHVVWKSAPFQGFTKDTPRESRFVIPCVTSTCRMHESDRKGICVGVYPFFLKHTRENCIFTAERDRGAFLYVYIYKSFRKKGTPFTFPPLRACNSLTVCALQRSAPFVYPWCTLSRLHPSDMPSKRCPFILRKA